MHLYSFTVRIPKDSLGVMVAIYQDHTVIDTVWTAHDLSSDFFTKKHPHAEFCAYISEPVRLTSKSAGWEVQPLEEQQKES